MRIHIKRIPTVALAALVTLVVALLSAPSSNAEELPDGWRYGAGVVGEKFAGVFRNKDNTPAYCADSDQTAPMEAGRYTAAGNGNFQQLHGKSLTDQENQTVSYLVNKWGNTDDKAQAAAVQFAVWSITTENMEFGSARMNQKLVQTRADKGIADKARVFLDEAKSSHGPFALHLKKEGNALIPQLIGANQKPVSGFSIKVQGLSSGKFNGKNEQTIKSGEPIRVEHTGFEEARFTAQAQNLPGQLKWYLPENTKAQRILVATGTSDIKADLAYKVAEPMDIKVTTQTSAALAKKGEKLTDSLVVEPSVPNAQWLKNPVNNQPVEVVIKSTLWGPFTEKPQENDKLPEEKYNRGSVETKVNMFGTYKTPEIQLPESGFYVWTEETLPEKTQPAGAKEFVNHWKGKFGLVPETTLVKWNIKVNTEVSRHIVKRDDSVTDHLKVSGFNGKGTKPLKLKVYGPEPKLPKLSEETPQEAKLHKELTVKAENGEFVSEEIKENQPGCYTIVTEYEGDELHEAFKSPYGEPTETFCIHDVDSPGMITEKELKEHFEKHTSEKESVKSEKESVKEKETIKESTEVQTGKCDETCPTSSPETPTSSPQAEVTTSPEEIPSPTEESPVSTSAEGVESSSHFEEPTAGSPGSSSSPVSTLAATGVNDTMRNLMAVALIAIGAGCLLICIHRMKKL